MTKVKKRARWRVSRRPKGENLLITVSPTLRLRLENWGAAMRVPERPGISQTYAVCERMARLKGQIEDARRPKAEIDEIDAALVERAWRAKLMTPTDKDLLRGYYVMRLHPGHLGRLLSIPKHQFDARLYASHILIHQILDRIDHIVDNRAQFDPSRATREPPPKGEVPPQKTSEARAWRMSLARSPA